MNLSHAACFLVALLIGAVAFFMGDGYGRSRVTTAEPEVIREWALPARFEAEGAFTLGCSLWDVPLITPYGADNVDEGFAALQIGSGLRGLELLAYIDGPNGSTLLSGMACGISVDWSAFPEVPRPGR